MTRQSHHKIPLPTTRQEIGWALPKIGALLCGTHTGSNPVPLPIRAMVSLLVRHPHNTKDTFRRCLFFMVQFPWGDTMPEKDNGLDYKVSLWDWITSAKSRRIKKKQKELAEFQLDTAHMNQQQKDVFLIRKKQNGAINGTSWSLIAIITTLWSCYYNIPFFQNHMSFMAMGLSQTEPSWADHIMMFIVPAGSGCVLHGIPHLPFIPKKVKPIVSIVLKIVPVILLIIGYVLIYYEKQIRKIKKTVYNESAE